MKEHSYYLSSLDVLCLSPFFLLTESYHLSRLDKYKFSFHLVFSSLHNRVTQNPPCFLTLYFIFLSFFEHCILKELKS